MHENLYKNDIFVKIMFLLCLELQFLIKNVVTAITLKAITLKKPWNKPVVKLRGY